MKESKQNPNIIVIAGYQRSGTSLLSRLFDGHSEILSFECETNFFTQLKLRERLDPREHFYYLFGRPYDFTHRKKQNPGTFIDPHINWQKNEIWQTIERTSDTSKIKEKIIDTITGGTSQDIFMAMVSCYEKSVWKKQNPPRYVLEKTPGNEFYLKAIGKNFPQAKIIHIVRDPFDVFESILRNKEPKKQESMLPYLVSSWKKSTLLGIFREKMYPQKYKVVDFESIVHSPKETLEDLSRFLGIHFDSSLLQPTTKSGQEMWKSHTHQDIVVADGTIDERLLAKDASKILGERYMQFIASSVEPEYHYFGWNKYKTVFAPKQKNEVKMSFDQRVKKSLFKGASQIFYSTLKPRK